MPAEFTSALAEGVTETAASLKASAQHRSFPLPRLLVAPARLTLVAQMPDLDAEKFHREGFESSPLRMDMMKQQRF